MIATIFAAAAAFIGTNVDDILILTFFFAQADSRRGRWAVTAGQYLGIGTLTAMSMLGSRVLQLIPAQYIGLMGLIPIALGIQEIVPNRKEEDTPAEKAASDALQVMLITLANGADNIGVYLPLFAGYSAPQLAVTAVSFALLTTLWCFFGLKLASLPVLNRLIKRYRRILVPAVYLLLGVYILAEGFF